MGLPRKPQGVSECSSLGGENSVRARHFSRCFHPCFLHPPAALHGVYFRAPVLYMQKSSSRGVYTAGQRCHQNRDGAQSSWIPGSFSFHLLVEGWVDELPLNVLHKGKKSAARQKPAGSYRDSLGKSPGTRPESSRQILCRLVSSSGSSLLPPEVRMTFCPVPWGSSS